METSEHKHFILFKPYGYLSQFVNNDVSKHKKKLLGELYDFPNNTMAIEGKYIYQKYHISSTATSNHCFRCESLTKGTQYDTYNTLQQALCG